MPKKEEKHKNQDTRNKEMSGKHDVATVPIKLIKTFSKASVAPSPTRVA